MTARATARGEERTSLDGTRADVLICGASFAGLAVARELAGQRRRRAARRPLRDRRAPDLRLRGAGGLAARDGRRALAARGAAGHDVHHAARHRALPAAVALGGVRLPRRSARTLFAQCDARFETAKVDGRDGLHASHTDRGDLHAPLIVDALGWRRVLATRRLPAARRAAQPRPGGPPARRDRPTTRWTSGSTASLAPRASPGACPRARRSASASAPTSRATTCASRPRTSPGASAPSAERWQGNWFPHRLRPAAEDGVFFCGDSAGHCFPLSGEGIRTAFHFGIAAGRELRAVLAGRAHAATRRWRATPRSARATRARSAARCACSGSSRRCRRAS